MMHDAYKLKNGRRIPAYYNARADQWRTRVCRPGSLYAYARTLEGLAAETGRTYASKAGALRAAKREGLNPLK